MRALWQELTNLAHWESTRLLNLEVTGSIPVVSPPTLLRLARAAAQDVGKSGIPRAPGARDRWFKSSRPDLIDPVWPNGKAAAC